MGSMYEHENTRTSINRLWAGLIIMTDVFYITLKHFCWDGSDIYLT